MYRNYIFDLYATLIDIRTDPADLKLWHRMADLYRCYGADYEPDTMRTRYQAMDREERIRMRCSFPEPDLRIVFARLLLEAEKSHTCSAKLLGREIEELRQKPQDYIDAVAESDWCISVMTTFRICSYKHIRLYPDTIETLRELRRNNCGIYLLSNAQAVFTRPEIERFGLNRWFDGIYLSSDYGIMKPDPEFMEILLEKENLDRRHCVMVGNELESDMTIAMETGVNGIWLNTSKKPQIRKYREFLRAYPQAEYAMKTIADGRISHLLEV